MTCVGESKVRPLLFIHVFRCNSEYCPPQKLSPRTLFTSEYCPPGHYSLVNNVPLGHYSLVNIVPLGE